MSNLYQGQCSSPLHIYYLSSTGHDHKKKNHSKKKLWHFKPLHWAGCQRDVSARSVEQRSSCSFKRVLSSHWRCTVPAIRALRANVALHKHKALQHGQTLSATLDACRPMIKIHYNFLQPPVQEAARQPHIEHIHMTNSLAIYANVEHNFITNK